MAHGLPVLTSTSSALPEVAGDAALLVDPLQTDAIADGLLQLLDLNRRQSLVSLGLERAKQFSWENSAQMTAAVYREIGTI